MKLFLGGEGRREEKSAKLRVQSIQVSPMHYLELVDLCSVYASSYTLGC